MSILRIFAVILIMPSTILSNQNQYSRLLSIAQTLQLFNNPNQQCQDYCKMFCMQEKSKNQPIDPKIKRSQALTQLHNIIMANRNEYDQNKNFSLYENTIALSVAKQINTSELK
ncbi:MAG: hypothetical protein CL947_02690 [Epsilonproteobacteria bacterium]|nr:hypothetical protein [Campylobacterota bacterium]|tara:strand:+ start:4924 stop:5265 length:342 start_codon:yes stop_codon:yes gene_type:complete